jgi:DNA polymerase-3 subunit delta'
VILADVQSQERAVGVLRRVLADDRLAHAYIFAGPGGVGKRATAVALAHAALCTTAPGSGCESCAECHLVAVGSHPDVFVEDLARARIDKPTTNQISIDQVRRVSGHLALKPARGGRKIAIIDQAERLTLDAQNALLKTLEEPAGTATLVLVATNPGALLPTIRSRCQILTFAPLPAEVVAGILEDEGATAPVAADAARLADGSLDAARQLADPASAEARAALQAKLARLERAAIPEVLDLASELSPRGERSREQQAAHLATIVEWCRGELEASIERFARERAASGEPADAEALDDRLQPVRQALAKLTRAYATTRDLERNANAHLALDRLLLDLQ